MRFGRKSGSQEPDVGSVEESDASSDQVEAAVGPFDISEVDEETRDCVDLGSLLVTPVGEMELRLQVEEESGAVIAAVLVAEEGALELRAFAASRGGGAWDELRPRIAAETARMGGTVTEQEGSFGTEMLCQVPVEDENGQLVTQASRIVAHEGERVDAARDADGPARGRRRERRSVGGDDPADRRTSWPRGDGAGRRPAPLAASRGQARRLNRRSADPSLTTL